MNRSIRLASAALFVLIGAGSAAAHAQTMVAADVKPGDWAYDAVQDLASKGLIKGYPPDGNFLGNRALTRFEMASIISRVLGRMDELAQSGQNVQSLQAQIDETKKLADDYKVELTVIGTDMTQAKSDIAKLQGDVATLQQGLTSAYDAIEEQSKRVDATNKVVKTKVDSGAGALKIDGLLQVWALSGRDVNSYATGGVTGISNSFRLRRAEITLNGNLTPQLYYKAQIDPAKQLSLITSTTTLGKVSSVSGSGQTVVTSASVNQASQVLQDLYVGYKLNGNVRAELGQQKVPMSMDGFRSSAGLYTVERTLFNEVPYGNGRVGDIRDTGAVLRVNSNPSEIIAPTTALNGVTNITPQNTAARFEGAVGVFDDGGSQQNTFDNNNRKEYIGHLGIRATPQLYVGAYGEASGGVNGIYETQRQRSGAELSTTILGKQNLIEGEIEQARDGSVTTTTTTSISTSTGALTSTSTTTVKPKIRSNGAYLMYVRTLSDKVWFAVRGDYYNPNRDAHGSLRNDEWDLVAGPSFLISKTGSSQSQIQFNYIHKDINGPKTATGGAATNASFLGQPRDIYVLNFQQAF